MTWERHLEHWIVGHRVEWLDWFFIALSWIGTLGAVWIVLGLALAVMWRRPSIVVLTAAAVVGGELFSDLGKALIARHRPFEHQIGPPSATHSFPSGHAATSFAGATVLAHFAPRLRVPLFVLAALIAFSRVYNGMHYPTDILVGAAGGVAIALLLLAADRRRSRRAPRRD